MALAIFSLTYLLIIGTRLPFIKLDRPGGALLGAMLMVLLGVVTPGEVFGHSADPAARAVDADTLLLLFGMMLLGGYLAEAAFFRTAAFHVIRLARTPRVLLVAVSVASAVLSALLVNDTVCLMLAPLVLAVAEDAELPPVPYLMALCMASNAGSVATFTGNPQNMLIQGASGLSFARFAAFMAVPAALSVAVVVALLLLAYRAELQPRQLAVRTAPPPVRRGLLALAGLATAGVVAAFFAGLPLGWSALGGGVAVMALSGEPPRRVLEGVDWVLLLFFGALFVVVHGVHKEGWAEAMRDALLPLLPSGPVGEPWGLAALTLLGSNLFSNVPFVMLARTWVPALGNPEQGWQVLALASTLAGNLTLVGSVANLIVFEAARERVHVSFWAYARLGIPVTLVSLALGMAALLLEHHLFG